MRLAAKLTGWRIDIKSEEEKRREVEAQFGAFEGGEADAQAQMDALFPDAADTRSDEADAAGEPVKQGADETQS